MPDRPTSYLLRISSAEPDIEDREYIDGGGFPSRGRSVCRMIGRLPMRQITGRCYARGAAEALSGAGPALSQSGQEALTLHVRAARSGQAYWDELPFTRGRLCSGGGHSVRRLVWLLPLQSCSPGRDDRFRLSAAVRVWQPNFAGCRYRSLRVRWGGGPLDIET